MRKCQTGGGRLKKKILVIGSLNMDMVIEMKHMPKPGETVLGETLSYKPGGKGGNQAYAAAKLGGSASMLGCVGSDALGKKLLDSMAESGADTSHIFAEDREPTGMAVIFVTHFGDNSIVVVPGANTACDTGFIKQNEELIRESDYIMFQMEIPYETVFYGICAAEKYGKKVILNPAPAPDPGEVPDEIWDKIDYLTPNETELLKLSGRSGTSLETIKAGAGDLLEKGVKNILVTMGSRGALFLNKKQEIFCPARKVNAVDTTAAGDCFNGAFVAGLAEGMSIPEAVNFANTASSIAVMRKGAQCSIPERSEVEALIEGNEGEQGKMKGGFYGTYNT